jgi:hypothetical protein
MAGNQMSDDYRQPDDPRRGNPGDNQWDAQGQPPKAGMSGGMKACLIVAAIFGCCCVLCCGIGGYLAYSFVPKISQNAADIDAARSAMANITLPPGYAPTQLVKIDNLMLSVTRVVYKNIADHGEISLSDVQIKFGNPAQREEIMRQQLERQGFGPPKPLSNAKTETKEISIKGRDCNFLFKRGEEAGTKRKVRQITGVFEGNNAPVSINIEMDDSAYKQDAVIKMLEGIK